MGVDGRDEQRDGEAWAGDSEATPPPQVPGQNGPLGATSPADGPAERHDRAGGPAGGARSVPP
ncbi:hypothetical protein, partial [Streptomyces inhibens]|uniref:hypothetical protein n=1 Tax=Streptomyces inhibens TaxID=2293571 RepID=UPI003CC825F2